MPGTNGSERSRGEIVFGIAEEAVAVGVQFEHSAAWLEDDRFAVVGNDILLGVGGGSERAFAVEASRATHSVIPAAMPTRPVITAWTVPAGSAVPTWPAARTTRTATPPAALFPFAHITHVRRPSQKEARSPSDHEKLSPLPRMPKLAGIPLRLATTARESHFARKLQTPFHPEEHTGRSDLADHRPILGFRMGLISDCRGYRSCRGLIMPAEDYSSR